MKHFRLLGPIIAAAMVLSSMAVASAAPSMGVMVLHGFVMIDGKPAPKGTVVKAKLGDNTEIANTTTGSSGMAANQWRMDIQVSKDMQGDPVYLKANGASGNLASTTLESNRARGMDLVGYSSGSVNSLHSPVRQAAAGVAAWSGATVFHGWVVLDGKPAPKGTVVTASLSNGTKLGSSATGSNGLMANQYRIDVQAEAWMQDRTVNFKVGGKTVGTATFAANRAFNVDLVSGVSLSGAAETIASYVSEASSSGVVVFHGFVTLNGAAAPANTLVRLVRSDGTVIATTRTGTSGLKANQYRFDVQSDANLNQSPVQLAAGSVKVGTMFRANHAISVDIHSS